MARGACPIMSGRPDLAPLHLDMALNAVALGELSAPCSLWVPTVRDLIASSERLWPGREVAALGYHRPGDGGGGVFRFSVNPPAADGGIVIPRRSGKGGWIRQMRTAALNAEMFGMDGGGEDGEGTPPEGQALQALLDGAAQNGVAAVLTAGKHYAVDRALFVRASGLHLMGNGATLSLMSDEIKGSVLCVCNASDIQIESLNIDVYGRFQSGLTLIGNTQEFPEVTALGPAAAVSNVVLRDIAIANAGYHINRRETVTLAVQLVAPQVGDIVDGIDSVARPVEGDIVAIAPDGPRLTIDWRVNRVQPFTMLTLRRNGSRGLVQSRTSVPMEELLSGLTFDSWTGKFGGKGLSIQRACSQISVEGVRTTDCDIGLSLEAHPPAPQNGITDIDVSNLEIVRANRTAIWIHSSAGQSPGAMQVKVSDVQIVDPCGTGDRMGVISLDRAAHVVLEDIAISFTTPPALDNFAIIRGLFTQCSFSDIRFDGPAECAVAYEPHARWGNAPGDFPSSLGGNSCDIQILNPSLVPRLLRWYAGGLKPVQSSFHFSGPTAFSAAQQALPEAEASISLTTSIIGA
jgi:hypothetical protein